MKCTRTDSGGESQLRLEGVLDVHTAPHVRPMLDELVESQPHRVVVDIAAVTMLDSSGVGLLMALCKRVRANGGDVSVVGANDQPLVVIRVLKLEAFFGLPK